MAVASGDMGFFMRGPNPDLPIGTVFYSHLDGDMSENKHDITLYGGLDIIADGGKYGGAWKFNGSTQYAEIPDAASLDSQELSVCVWCKFDDATGDQYLVDRTWTSGGGWRWHIRRSNGSSKIHFFLDSGSGDYDAFSDNNFTDTTSYHLFVGTWDGSTLRLYIDSVLQSDTGTVSGTFASTNPIGLGRAGDNSAYFEGKLDTVYVTDKALSQSEITSMYNADSFSEVSGMNTIFLCEFGGDISKGHHDITTVDGQIINSIDGSPHFNGLYKLDGSADYIRCGISDEYNFGDENWTCAGFFTWDSTSQHGYLFDRRSKAGSPYSGFEIRWLTTNQIQLYYNVSDVQNGGNLASFTPTIGQRYYILVVRDGTTVHCFVDGISIGTMGVGTAYFDDTSSYPFVIGAHYDSSPPYLPFNGKVDEALVVKGSALYVENFEPPTLPYGIPSINTDINFTMSGSPPSSTADLNFYSRGYNSSSGAIPFYQDGLEISSASLSFYTVSKQANANVNFYSNGYEESSGNLPFYSYGKENTNTSINFYEHGWDNFNTSMQFYSSGNIGGIFEFDTVGLSSGEMNFYTKGAYLKNAELPYYIRGIDSFSGVMPFYTKGHLYKDSSLNYYTRGHDVASGDMSFWMSGAYIKDAELDFYSKGFEVMSFYIFGGLTPNYGQSKESLPFCLYNNGSDEEVDSLNYSISGRSPVQDSGNITFYITGPIGEYQDSMSFVLNSVPPTSYATSLSFYENATTASGVMGGVYEGLDNFIMGFYGDTTVPNGSDYEIAGSGEIAGNITFFTEGI